MAVVWAAEGAQGFKEEASAAAVWVAEVEADFTVAVAASMAEAAVATAAK